MKEPEPACAFTGEQEEPRLQSQQGHQLIHNADQALVSEACLCKHLYFRKENITCPPGVFLHL